MIKSRPSILREGRERQKIPFEYALTGTDADEVKAAAKEHEEILANYSSLPEDVANFVNCADAPRASPSPAFAGGQQCLNDSQVIGAHTIHFRTLLAS
jgi:hypothetical protein